jgi:CBS domain-containing protein
MTTVRDIMTPEPLTVPPTASVQEAAQLMRDHGVGDVLICDDEGHITGVLTDRDIAIRACAEGLPPERTAVARICSDESIAMISPDDNVHQAVMMMREKAIRRLPVVEDGRPIGIVSLGDLALAEDPKSALGEISAQPPNA